MSDPSTPNPQLIPLGIMAADLGVAASDLRSEALAGRVPCTRVGKRGMLFDRELVHRTLLERMLREQEEQDA